MIAVHAITHIKSLAIGHGPTSRPPILSAAVAIAHRAAANAIDIS